MKRADEAVEKMLAGLREAEAPMGMERRILEAVRDRAEVGAGIGRGWVWAGGMAVMVVGCLMVGMLHRSGSGVVPVGVRTAEVGWTAPAVATEVAARPAGKATRSRGRSRLRRVAVDADLVAEREMRASSKVAPPMPLTEEEQLLVRVAQKGDPEEVAMLRSELRAKQDADGKTEFERFFGKSTTGSN